MIEVIIQNQENTPTLPAIFVDGFNLNNQFQDQRHGGFKIVSSTGAVLEVKEGDGFTNNFWELAGIAKALSYAKNLGVDTIYTDSQVALWWIKNRSVGKKVNNPAKVMEVINYIYSFVERNNLNIKIKLWLTSKWGAIPADVGNK